jgi:exonuclease VII small subunit
MNAERRDDMDSQTDEPVGELSYMAASRELDGIVEFFERSEVDVDQLVARLERATAIVDELDRRIRRTRAQVEELVPKLEAAGRTAASEQVVVGVGDEADELDDRSGATGVDIGGSAGETLPF